MELLSRGAAKSLARLDSTLLRYLDPSADLSEYLSERLELLGGFALRENDPISATKGFRREREVGFAESGEPSHCLRIVLLESPKVKGEFFTAEVHGGRYFSLLVTFW
jgi:hypothetical protein